MSKKKKEVLNLKDVTRAVAPWRSSEYNAAVTAYANKVIPNRVIEAVSQADSNYSVAGVTAAKEAMKGHRDLLANPMFSNYNSSYPDMQLIKVDPRNTLIVNGNFGYAGNGTPIIAHINKEGVFTIINPLGLCGGPRRKDIASELLGSLVFEDRTKFPLNRCRLAVPKLGYKKSWPLVSGTQIHKGKILNPMTDYKVRVDRAISRECNLELNGIRELISTALKLMENLTTEAIWEQFAKIFPTVTTTHYNNYFSLRQVGVERVTGLFPFENINNKVVKQYKRLVIEDNSSYELFNAAKTYVDSERINVMPLALMYAARTKTTTFRQYGVNEWDFMQALTNTYKLKRGAYWLEEKESWK